MFIEKPTVPIRRRKKEQIVYTAQHWRVALLHCKKKSEKKIKIYSKVVWYVKDDTLHLFDNNS